MRRSFNTNQNRWTAHRKVTVALIILAVFGFTAAISQDWGLAIILSAAGFVLAGIFTDPNTFKSDVELRSTIGLPPAPEAR